MRAPSLTSGFSVPASLGQLAPCEGDAASDSGTRLRAATTVDTRELLGLLYRQLRSLGGPRPDLDDIVQNAAERALRSLHRFEGRSSFSTWTYGVAYRTLLDHDRWYARLRRRISYVEEAEISEAPSRFDSESLVLAARRARRLYQALNQLPPAKRAVVVLHDMEGLSAKEITEIVHSNEGTVRSRLRDGRARLALLLSADPLFESGGTP